MFPRLLAKERGVGLNVGGEAMNRSCSCSEESDCVCVCVESGECVVTEWGVCSDGVTVCGCV